MSILVPKVHQDGSQIGMHGREWSNVISNVTYTSSSFIDGANILSGTHGLEVDERLIVVSPYPTADVQASLSAGIVPLRINNLLAATDSYDMGGQKITNLGSPTSSTDAAPKSYVDQAITGLKWKQSVKGSSVDKGSPTTIYWKDFEEATWTGSEQAGYTQTSYGNPGWIFTDSGGVQKLELRRPRQSRTGGNLYGLNINTSNLVWNDGTSQQNHPIDEYLFDDVNTFKNGERVLVNVFQDASRNGIYEFETTGSSNETGFEYAKPVLVRTDDFNLTAEVSSAAVFIEEGTQNADTAFVCTTNNTDIEDALIGTYNIDWTVYGTQAVDNVTIYKDTTQSERLEVTGVLRDINDIYYNYSTGARLNVEDGQFLVGNGTTFVAESGDTVRTSMGLGTTNSPTFTNLTLTGGELTASHFVSNTGNPTDPITLSSPLSGTVSLTANSIALDTSVTSNTLTTVAGATIGTTLAVNGQLSANGGIVVANTETISGAKSISAQFVTASVALSASYIQLREFADQTTFESAYPTNNSLYVYDDALFFDGSAIAGGGVIGGQPKENVLFYGGNLTSDTATSGDHSPTVFYMRMGVSGSHQSAITDAAGRNSAYQILTGSFAELTGSKVDIDGGTIDGVAGNFTSIITPNATITGGAITDTSISGSTGIFSALEADTADINGGTIDGTTIGGTTSAPGTFSTLATPSAAITGGSISGVAITTSTANLTSLTAATADINGGTISNTTIDNTNIINVDTGNFENGIFTDLTASNFIMPKTGDQGYVDVTVSNTTQDSQISYSGNAKLRIVATDLTASDAHIQGGSLTGSFGVFTALTGSSAHIQGGSLTGSFGLFSVLTGSDVDINAGTIDGTEIGSSARSTGKFTELTGSDVVIENLLTASHNATIDFNNNLVQNVATVDLSAGQRKDAVNREYIDTVVGIKTKVRLAASSNVDTASVSLGDEIDGVGALALADGDRILLTNQSTNSENGIYVFDNSATPKLQRPFDYLTGDNAGGFVVLVEEGTANGQSIFSLKSTGVVDTADITVTKISSQYGVSSEGKGISKNINIFSVNLQDGDWDSDTPADRANLTFRPVTGETDKLILSSSVRVDELKVVDSTGTEGRVQISGSADSYIDNVQIGMNTPANATFNNLDITNTHELTLVGNAKITGSLGATSKIELSEGRFDKLSVPGVMTAERTSTPEHFVTIHESLKFAPATLANRSQRLYLNNGDLYFENHKIGSGGGTTPGSATILSDFTSIYVTGSQADGHGAFISGSMIVEGDLQIRGTTTTVSSSNTTFQDSIIGLGITGSHSGNEEFNNLGDRGIIFARGANQTDALPGMWWDGGKFNFAKSVTSPSSGSFGTITQRSTVATGDLDALEVTATEVTASAGLNIGGNTGFNFPTTDGNADQVLTTDGSGYLSWADQSGGESVFEVKATTTQQSDITPFGSQPQFNSSQTAGLTFINVSSPLVIDGVTINLGDKILIRHGHAGHSQYQFYNGVYEYKSLTGSTIRLELLNGGAHNLDIHDGFTVYVQEGTVNKNLIFVRSKLVYNGDNATLAPIGGVAYNYFETIDTNFLARISENSDGKLTHTPLLANKTDGAEAVLLTQDDHLLTLKGDTANTEAAAIKFNCEQNQHGVTIQGPAHSNGATYTLTLPPDGPTADQILVSDGSGNLTFQDNIPKQYVRDDLVITKDPAVFSNSNLSQTTDTFNLNGSNTDVFVLDFSNRSVAASGYNSSGARYLTINVSNLSSEFHQKGKEFYVGIKGFDFTAYQAKDSAAVYLGFVLDSSITGYTRDNALQGHSPIFTTYTNANVVHVPNLSGNSKVDIGARHQFASGDIHSDSSYKPYLSRFLDRVDTNSNKIYCLKFEIIQGQNGLEWVTNYDNIIVFDDNDPRLI